MYLCIFQVRGDMCFWRSSQRVPRLWIDVLILLYLVVHKCKVISRTLRDMYVPSRRRLSAVCVCGYSGELLCVCVLQLRGALYRDVRLRLCKRLWRRIVSRLRCEV